MKAHSRNPRIARSPDRDRHKARRQECFAERANRAVAPAADVLGAFAASVRVSKRQVCPGLSLAGDGGRALVAARGGLALLVASALLLAPVEGVAEDAATGETAAEAALPEDESILLLPIGEDELAQDRKVAKEDEPEDDDAAGPARATVVEAEPDPAPVAEVQPAEIPPSTEPPSPERAPPEPAMPQPPPPPAVAAKKPDEPKSAWRGSSFSYGHQGSAISAFPGAEPFWNPYYAHQLSLRPELHFESLPFFLRGRFSLNQELTLSDETTYRNEVVWSDVVLEAVAQSWTEPVTKLQLGGSLRLTAPLSKAAWAQTLYLAASPSVSVSRRFDVLSGLTLAWSGRYSAFFNRSTTSAFAGPRIPCGDADSPLCQQLSHSGVRNGSWSLSHGPVVALAVTPRLAFTFVLNQFRTQLYALTPVTVGTDTGPVEVGERSGIDARYATLASLDASYALTADLALTFGVSTFSSQLAPDSTYRNPLLNRFTSLNFEVQVDMERLAARVSGRQP